MTYHGRSSAYLTRQNACSILRADSLRARVLPVGGGVFLGRRIGAFTHTFVLEETTTFPSLNEMYRGVALGYIPGVFLSRYVSKHGCGRPPLRNFGGRHAFLLSLRLVVGVKTGIGERS